MLGRFDRLDVDPPEDVEPEAARALARLGRELSLRRALEEAADHAAAMLPALGLQRLVGPDFSPLDTAIIGESLDNAINLLDALDADPDLEPWLGYHTPGLPMDAEAEPEHDEDDAISEPSLASPERHPTLPWSGNSRRHYVTRDRQDTQARWADGGRQDIEGCITDEPHDGDGEDLEAEPAEDSLGSPVGDGDQRHWAQGYDGEREADPCDGPGLVLTAAQCQAAWERKPALHALTRQARVLRSGSTMRRDPDAVTPIGPGMVLWQPLVTRNGVPVVGVTAG
ncbi:hypothetical protein [Lichenibacterium dinghuense]|uniref:hypothetical protein n=1 Tax=Lichenibacterium dinghuense TaxID=2895977 RepID=UPI001F480201|nr:hypothetical protein [Lichenibacterium sp. 6Y81]